MPDRRKSMPTGFVATCRCGVITGSLDYLRTPRADSARILGQWLHTGHTVEPRFQSSWRVSIEPCRCHLDFPSQRLRPLPRMGRRPRRLAR